MEARSSTRSASLLVIEVVDRLGTPFDNEVVDRLHEAAALPSA